MTQHASMGFFKKNHTKYLNTELWQAMHIWFIYRCSCHYKLKVEYIFDYLFDIGIRNRVKTVCHHLRKYNISSFFRRWKVLHSHLRSKSIKYCDVTPDACWKYETYESWKMCKLYELDYVKKRSSNANGSQSSCLTLFRTFNTAPRTLTMCHIVGGDRIHKLWIMC